MKEIEEWPEFKKAEEESKRRQEKMNKKLESIRAVNRANFKISMINGSFDLEIKKTREKFSVPKLNKKEDTPDAEDAFAGDYGEFYNYPKSLWIDAFPEKVKKSFYKSINDSLKNLNLSYDLCEWFRDIILYNKKKELPRNTYYSAGNGPFLLREKEPLSLGEKYIFKEHIKAITEYFPEFKKYKKEWLEAIEEHPVKKDRRKRKIDEIIQIVEQHGKKETYYEPIQNREKEYKITDKELAVRLSENDKNIDKEAERIKKLRQRYVNILKR